MQCCKKHKPVGFRQNGCADENEVVIEVDEDAKHPNKAWQRLQLTNPVHVVPLEPLSMLAPPKRKCLRFVCLSDTHLRVERRAEFLERIPPGDVLIHAGDFTMGGDPTEVMTFNDFLSRLPHQIKLVIAGNHELTFEDGGDRYYGVHPALTRKALGLSISASDKEVTEACKACLTNAVYLQDQGIEICGLKLYGSPWVSEFGTSGFSLPAGYALLQHWNLIPSNTDILITHGPPLGYGDSFREDRHAGCVELLNTVVKRVKPKFHVFGHIHDGYGKYTNGETVFINASICDNRYRPKNNPIVFDVPLPKGYSYADFKKVTNAKLRETLNSGSHVTDSKPGSGENCVTRAGGLLTMHPTFSSTENGFGDLETKLAATSI